jgi:multimeric flavodoxin WrbA
MKTITAVLGSPKSLENSVTARLIQKYFHEIKTGVSEVKTDIISLSERNISICKGCLACKQTGKCPIPDEIENIRDQLRKSDLLVFASPVHISHVSATYKNFLDRLIESLHTFEFIGKPSVNIITCNGSGEQETKKYMNHIALVFGAIPLGTIIKLDNEEFNENSFKKTIIRSIEVLTGKKKLQPTLLNSLYFMSMKSIILKNKQYFEYAEGLWRKKGWDKMGYRKAMANQDWASPND